MYENIDGLEPEDLELFKEDGLTDRPQDYYFAIDTRYSNEIVGDASIIITPKLLWDTEKCWSDSGWLPAILEKHLNGYFDLMEATFEMPVGMTISQVRTDLTTRGFVENPSILGTNG